MDAIRTVSAVLTCSLLLLITTGCERAEEDRASKPVVDTVSSVVIVTNPSSPTPSAASAEKRGADTIRPPRGVSIGTVDGAEEYSFGHITSLAVDGPGNIYVADGLAGEIRVYTSGGEFIQRIGRTGDGPGEFRAPGGLAFGPSGILYVRDLTRVQRFAPSPAGGVASRYVGSYPAPPYASSQLTSRVTSDGHFYFPRMHGRIPNQTYEYLIHDTTGAVTSTVTLPPSLRIPPETAIVRTSASGGRMVEGFSRAPFTPHPSWDVTPEGTLLVASGGPYEIGELSPEGDTIRVIRRQGEPQAVGAGEYRDSLRAVRQRIDSAPAPLERMEGVAAGIREGQFPRTLPQVIGIHVGTDGRIWVERWPEQSSGGAIFDVLDPSGVHETTVVLPVRFQRLPQPVFTASRAHGVTVDPETDVQRVRVFDLVQ